MLDRRDKFTEVNDLLSLVQTQTYILRSCIITRQCAMHDFQDPCFKFEVLNGGQRSIFLKIFLVWSI